MGEVLCLYQTHNHICIVSPKSNSCVHSNRPDFIVIAGVKANLSFAGGYNKGYKRHSVKAEKVKVNIASR